MGKARGRMLVHVVERGRGLFLPVWVRVLIFQEASELLDLDQKARKTMWGQFWSAHQRFFKYLCIAAKVPHVVAVTNEAIKDGSKCVVIGLQSTGEARTMEMLEECGGELQEFVSTCKGVFQSLIDKHFPVPNKPQTKKLDILGELIYASNTRSVSPPVSVGEKRKPVGESLSSLAKKPKPDPEPESEDSEASSSSEPDDDDDSPESDSEVDDYNPFADSGSEGGSDDSGDWLGLGARNRKKKGKRKKPGTKTKTPKAKKEKKSKKEGKDTNGGTNKTSHQTTPSLEEESDDDIDSFPVPPPSTTKPSTMNDLEKAERAYNLKQMLLDKLEALSDRLPLNTLDELIDLLGGPDKVAELTGRKGRVISTRDGSVSYVSRSESEVSLDVLNIKEKERFMNGEKLIAIISEAASSGISLQADRRAINQRRRVHVTLELPWSADRAVQQFGRTHRSNQVSAPQYIFMISDLAGERRFASTVARRLECLGALTHGDRRANESQDLSRFNIDNKFGHHALRTTLRAITGEEKPLVSLPSSINGSPNGFKDDARTGLVGVGLVIKENPNVSSWRMDERTDMSKFLNRILGLKVDIQNAVFDYFTRTLQSIILASKQSGSFDMGILDLGLGPGETVRKIDDRSVTYTIRSATGTYSVDLNCFGMERGMTWTNAVKVWRNHDGPDDGFYVSRHASHAGRHGIILAVALPHKKGETGGESSTSSSPSFQIYKANTGLQSKRETAADLKRKFQKVIASVAEAKWRDHFDKSSSQCSHLYWSGGCQKTARGLRCEIGLRTRNYHVLCGSVLSAWGSVESFLNSTGVSRTMQLIRLRTEDDHRIVGCLIPNNVVNGLYYCLRKLENQNSDPNGKKQPPAPLNNMNKHPPSRLPHQTAAPYSVSSSYASTTFNKNYAASSYSHGAAKITAPQQQRTPFASSHFPRDDDDDDDDDPDEVEIVGAGKKSLDLFM